MMMLTLCIESNTLMGLNISRLIAETERSLTYVGCKVMEKSSTKIMADGKVGKD